MPTDDLKTCRSILNGTAQRFRDLRGRHELKPQDDSIAAQQLGEEEKYAGEWATQPIQDALSTSDLRLLAAADFLESVARLVEPEPKSFGPAAPARSAVECAARAWWLLDPEIDTPTRVIRGMVDRLLSITEASRVPSEEIQAQVAEARRLTVEGAEEFGWDIRWSRRGALLGIGEVDTPGAMALMRDLMDDAGESNYRFLAAITHGTLYGLMNVTETAMESDKAGITYVQPVTRPATIATWGGVAALAFFEAFDRQIALFGWEKTDWRAWLTESRRAIYRLLTKPQG